MIDGRKIVASVEARMRSERLPGKVLRECLGRPLLALLVERVSRSAFVDEVVIATTGHESCDPLAEVALAAGAKVFRGSEENVSERVAVAMEEAGADIVVQLTGDNPLVDPAIIDELIRQCVAGGCDFVTNARMPGYPEGFEVQVMPIETLRRSHAMSTDSALQEHVCLAVHENPDLFRIQDAIASPPLRRPDLRLTLDTEFDLTVIREVFSALYPANSAFDCGDVIRFLDRAPDVAQLNAGVMNKTAR
jgi:spore coat polysaccharide biosynthesis protein SpsF